MIPDHHIPQVPRQSRPGTNSLLSSLLGFLLALIIPFAATPSLAQAPSLGLYDDFSGGQIDSAKWSTLEIVREIQNGRLVSSIRGADALTYSYINRLPLANPGNIKGFQADVRMNGFTGTSSAAMAMYVGLEGSYYNDGTLGPGATGDIRARLMFNAVPSVGAVTITYQVIRCTNADCTSEDSLVGLTGVKGAALGETHTLGIDWDDATKKFTFTVDGDGILVPSPVPLSRATPNVPLKALDSWVVFGWGVGGVGSVSGDFTNVYARGNSGGLIFFDDFSSSQLDPSKWAALESVRKADNGQFRSIAATAGPAGTRETNRLRFLNQNIVTAMQADVTVTNCTTTQGSTAQARLIGSFYNVGTSTGGTDATGDILGMIQVVCSNGGTPTVQFSASRCGDPLCNTASPVTNSTFDLGPINLGEMQTLRIAWDGQGKFFTYGKGTDPDHDFSPETPYLPAKPATGHIKDVRTQVSINSPPPQGGQGYGYIAATFDNVFVNESALLPSRLAPFIHEVLSGDLAGDVVSAGVGLRGTGNGIITLDLPSEARVYKALLYWATLGDVVHRTLFFDSNQVSGELIGQSDDPFQGTLQTFAYRADVTSYVTGNGPYTVAGLPSGLPPGETTEGASLVVLYRLRGATPRVVTINDGAVMLARDRVSFYATTLSGFVADSPATGTHLTFIVGDGESLNGDSEVAGLDAMFLSQTANPFSGTNGPSWDTVTYDASAALAGQAASATASLTNRGNDPLVWVAAILSVPGVPGYPLSVHSAGTGTGTITSTPEGIACNPTCTTGFPTGTLVTLTADAGPDSTFDGWSGEGCSGTASCTVTMTQARSVTATFTMVPPQSYGLVLTKVGTGSGRVTSNPPGINCGTTCTFSFSTGSTVNLTATADAGSIFAGWSGNSDCADGSLTMSGPRNCTATFTRVYTLTVAKSGLGSGTVSSTPPDAGISCGSDCSELYPSGTVVTLMATPASGSYFAGWSGACSGIGSCTVTMDANKAVTATFTLGYTLTVGTSGLGSGTVNSAPDTGIICPTDCTENYNTGITTTLTAFPAMGSYFAGWSGACSGTSPSCMVTMNQARAVSAQFNAAGDTTFPLSVTISGAGSITSDAGGINCPGDCTKSYSSGSTVTLTAAPTADSVFIGWGGACMVPGPGPCSVTMNGAKTVTAAFVSPATAPSDLSVYDDFDYPQPDPKLDPTRWGTPGATREFVREIRDGKLVMAYGESVLAGQRAGISLSRVNPNPPTSLQGLSAKVSLTAATPPPGGESRVFLRGVFYNTSGGAPGSDATNDVRAHIGVRVLATGNPEVFYYVFQCNDANCNSSTDLVVPKHLIDATLDQSYTVGIAWNGSQFTFTVGGTQATFTPTPGSVGGDPRVPMVGLNANVRADSGSTGGPGYVAGTFDDVTVNGSLFDNFDGGSYSGPWIARTKWNAGDTVLEVRDGQLAVQAYAVGGFPAPPSTLGLANPGPVTALAADVKVQAPTSPNLPGPGIAGLQGRFYRTLCPPASAEGDVGAEVAYTPAPDGTLSLSFQVYCTPSTGPRQGLAFHTFATGLPPNEFHWLFLVWNPTEKVFTYGHADKAWAFDPGLFAPVPAGNLSPISPFKGIFASANSPIGSSAGTDLKAVFDNVAVNTSANPNPVLTVLKTGTGTGTVSSVPDGISCGSDCTEAYAATTTVTLTANPDPGYYFAGWSDPGCPGTGTCSVTMGAAKTVTATFTTGYTLTITKTGTGTGTVASTTPLGGINCGDDCSESYASGTVVTLTATPDTGSIFTGWSGDADCTDGSVTIDAPKSCTATFTAGYTLTINKTGAGAVTSSPGGVDCGSDCTEPYAPDTPVTLTATADSGFYFTGWSGDPDCADGSLMMSGPRNCTATFVPLEANLVVAQGVNPDPGIVGSNLTYTLTATNAGPAPASGVTLNNSISGNLTFVSATASQGSCDGTNPLTCSLGLLGTGAYATVTIVVTPTVVGSLTSTASVTAAEPDPNTANNTAVAETAVVNTPTGTDVPVQPTDTTTGTAPATLTLPTVTQAGVTSLTTSSSHPTPPSGFQLVGPSAFYDLTTTAIFSGLVTVCISNSGVTSASQLLHFEENAWVDRTVSVDDVNHVICASVTSLSPFAVVSPVAFNMAPKVKITWGLQGVGDAFEVNATFTLGAGSNGIAPPSEKVTLGVGTYSTTIPAGSFSKDSKGEFKFKGVVSSVALEWKIRPLGGNSYELMAEGRGANLAGTANPVEVRLVIGNDAGSAKVTAKFQ